MTDFYCDLEGDQKLQIWFMTIRTFWQSETAPYPLTPQQAKLELCNYNNPVVGRSDECHYFAAFPYSPYLEPEIASDWLRASYETWHRYEICEMYGEGADQNKQCPSCGSYHTFEDAVMSEVWRCQEPDCLRVWSYNAEGQAYTPYRG